MIKKSFPGISSERYEDDKEAAEEFRKMIEEGKLLPDRSMVEDEDPLH